MKISLHVGLIGSFLFAGHFAIADDWKPIVPLDNSVFPSLAIATATIDQTKFNKTQPNYIGDVLGQLGVLVKTDQDNETFSVEISSSKFVRKTTFQGILPQAGVIYRIYPKIDYDYDSLNHVIEPIPETISFQVALNDRDLGIKQQTVEVRSIGDCPFAIKQPDGSIFPLKWMFAAYVDENNPIVDKILQQALQLKLVPKFDDYQRGARGVYQQMFAVWNVLQRRGIKYSNITTPSATSSTVFSQHVRFITDSITDTQANCVDGSVLFASIYRKIGLHAFLVIIPGHCYMGVAFDPRTRQPPIVVETTLIGNDDLNKPSFDRALNAIVSRRRNNLSLTSFEKACGAGLKEFQTALPHINAKEPEYYLILLDRARIDGIQPLPAQ
jgi:hypothetical protein